MFVAAGLVVSLVHAAPALAQRFAFERTFQVSGPAVVDVTTINGAIEVSTGDAGRVVVSGAATAKWSAPPGAVGLSEAFANAPSITQDGATIRMTPPADEAWRRAMTVNYALRVPPGTTVVSTTESGATSITGVSGKVTVKTQSAAVALRGLGGDVSVRTGSGAIEASLDGSGAVDIETGSSAIDLRGARGAVKTVTRSGATRVRGAPGGPWDLSSGSGAITVFVDPARAFQVDATSGSGSVKLEGLSPAGPVSNRHATGAVGGDGPLVRLYSRSGSITLSADR
jgi:putative adhesin